MSLIKKKTSTRMAEANRANAKKSTGPRTAQGIANSRRNAVKHGILAEKLPPGLSELGEGMEEFAHFRDGLRRALCPSDDLQEMLVDDLARDRCRLMRCHRAEVALQRQSRNGASGEESDAALLLPDGDLNRVIRYEGHVKGQFWNTLRMLMGLKQMAGESQEVAVDLSEGQPALPNEIADGEEASQEEGESDDEAGK